MSYTFNTVQRSIAVCVWIGKATRGDADDIRKHGWKTLLFFIVVSCDDQYLAVQRLLTGIEKDIPETWIGRSKAEIYDIDVLFDAPPDCGNQDASVGLQ